MKLRITQKGWEGYSDMLGAVRFKDGISVDHVSRADAEKIGCSISVEVLENEDEVDAGYNPNPAQQLFNKMNDSTDSLGVSINVEQRDKVVEGDPDFKAPAEKIVAFDASETKPTLYDFSRKTLEAVADKEGIKGLRSIAEPFGVRGASISGIITDLLSKKAGAEAA